MRRFIALVTLLNAFPYAFASSNDSGTIVISSTHLPAATSTNMKAVEVDGPNLFRYDISIQIQDVVTNAQAPIAGAVPPTSAGGNQSGSVPAVKMLTKADTGADKCQTPAGIPPDAAIMEETACELQAYAVVIPSQIAIDLINATDEQACFTNLQQVYSQPLLSPDQLRSLDTEVKRISSGNACLHSASGLLKDLENTLTATAILSRQQLVFKQSSTYSTWAAGSDKTTFDNSVTATTQILTTLQGLIASADVTKVDTTEQYNLKWLQRAKATANLTSWTQNERLTCSIQWFGKTSGQSVSLNWLDAATTGATVQSKVYVTNACLPDLTVTTGLGISFVTNPTYSFEPVTDHTANPPTTSQVIGTSTDFRITPLYVGQMNYSLLRPSRIGWHLSGGLGVGTSAAGTTGDIFLGSGVSLGHRSIFITPAVHLTQRQALQSGYKLGDPQGDLSTIPTTTHWKYGFALTFTFPVVSP